MPSNRNDYVEFDAYCALGEPLMSDEEFADLGAGQWAYIKTLTSEEARVAFPCVEDLPPGIDLYALLAADGTPIVLTDDEDTAIGHAIGDELEIAQVH